VRFVAALAAAGLAACSGSSAAVGPDAGPAPCRGALQVCGGALRDADGRTVILRGVNVSDRQKRAPHLDPNGPADYARLHSWGLNAVRFLVTWAAVEPSEGTYDEAYLDTVAQHLGWAANAGLAVILDMHQDVYGEGFGGDGAPRWACDEARYAAFVPKSLWFLNYTDPNVVACVDAFYAPGKQREHFVAAWRHVAARFAALPVVIGFDPLNEPFWGSAAIFDFEATLLAPLYLDVAAVVRASAPGWLVFAEPAASHNLGLGTRLPPLGLPGVVFAPHVYDTSAESGTGFDVTKRPALTAFVADLRNEADGLGAALWIGEYGAPAGTAGVSDYLAATYDGAGQAAASTMYWDYGRGGYALLDADGHEVPELVDAVVRPYPARVAGTLNGYAYDPAARTLTVRVSSEAAVTAPTEIMVPARVYPMGVKVECGGCAVETGDGVVRLRGALPAMVTVRPAGS
jgi:endoglycosylceramidase